MLSARALFSIELEAFRAFKERQRFDVLPLTVVYGRNQAGKSTLVRLLSLIADSRAQAERVLDVEGPAFGDMTFKELGWLGPGPLNSPRVALHAPDGAYVEMHLNEEQGEIFANRLRVGRRSEDKVLFAASLDEEFDSTATDACYASDVARDTWRGRLGFSRLLDIDGLPDHVLPVLKGVTGALQSLGRPQWLEANRLSARTSRPVRCCMSTGADLARRLSGAKTVVDTASEWLRRADVLGEQLTIDPNARGEPTLNLEAPGRGRLPISLAGEGARALVPIILCAAWAESDRGDRPTMLIVEEPESQLHPTLQIRLIERLLKTVAAGVPVILETHSVFMLRALQLAVLLDRVTPDRPMPDESRLDAAIAPDNVGLYWVERDGAAASRPARAVRIPITADGRLTGWRPGEMESEDALTRAIVDLRWQLAEVDPEVGTA